MAAEDASPLSSDFANGYEGWKAVDLAERDSPNSSYGKVLATLVDLQWQATGGQIGGYLSRKDTTSFAFFFDAPARYLGNMHRMPGPHSNFTFGQPTPHGRLTMWSFW